MDYLLSKKFDGNFTINFIGVETLTPDDPAMKLRLASPIVGIKKITDYSQIINGVIDESQYVVVKFKWQNRYDIDVPCSDCWSDLLPISALTGITTIPSEPFDLEIYFYRVDDKLDSLTPTPIYVGNDSTSIAVTISGEYEFNWTDGPFLLTNELSDQGGVILSVSDIYKIFNITDYMVVSDDNDNLLIYWRVTQDNGKTYSKWEPATKENLSTYRFNQLRFAKMQYLIKFNTPSNIPVNVYDIILIGEFQNVSANSMKTNMYGIRSDCVTGLLTNNTGTTTSGVTSCAKNIDTGLQSYSQGNGVFAPAMTNYELDMNFWTQGLSCYSSGTPQTSLAGSATSVTTSTTSSTQVWNPYDINKIAGFANTMANQLNDIFAWEVDYHLTDPDQNGTDFILHEYQLFNIVDVKKLKVLVPENKFPDNTVKMNTFSLDLFDTFEVHILKDEFKRKFGIDRRPAENDILFFCVINRLFYIKHAQVYRDIMNAGFYYKVILEKYEQKANIRNLSEDSKQMLDILTNNTTMTELFGEEIKNEEDKIANIEQFKPFTFDPMRYVVNNDVIRVQQNIMNDNINFSKTHYDFKDVVGKSAIIYKKTDNTLGLSDNRTFIFWANFNNAWDSNARPSRNAWKHYNIDSTLNFWFLNNFDEETTKGYRIWFHNKNLNIQINDKFYNISNVNLLTNIWYGVVIIMDQRQKTIDLKIYQRDNNYDIVMMNTTTQHIVRVDWLDTSSYTQYISAGYKPVDNEEKNSLTTTFKSIKENYYENIENQSYEHEIDMTITGSNIKMTNIRVMTEASPVEEINNLLNQWVIRDSQRVLLADNADKNIYTDNFVNKNWV